MIWQHTPFTLPLLLGAALAAALSVTAWRQRPIAGAKPLTLLLAAISFWSFTYAFEIASIELTTKVYWAKVEYFGIVLVPLTWFAFLAHYSENGHLVTPRVVALLFIVPVITLVAVWTNDYHKLYWTANELETSQGFTLVDNSYGPLFLLWIAYSYILLALTTALVLRVALRSPQLSLVEVGILLVGAFLPWFSNAVSVSPINPFPGLDMTPFALLLSCAILVGKIGQQALLDVRPVVREVAFDHMRDGIVVLDRSGCVIALNQSAQRLLQRPTDALLDQPAATVFNGWPDLADGIEAAGTAVLETTLAAHSARPIHIEIQLAPLYDRRQRLAGRIITLRNVSERKQIEAQIRYEATLMQNITDAVITLNGLTITDWNKAAEALYGWRRDQVVGRAITHVFQQNRTNTLAEALQFARSGGHWRGELQHSHKDGTPIHVLSSISLLQDADGHSIGLLMVNRDITKYKQAEESLRETQKLESIGLLAGGVAHDFNNLLTSMLAQTSLARAKLPPDSKAGAHIEKAATSARRAADVTRQLLAYAGRGKMQTELVDLNALITENMSLFGAAVSAKTHLYTDLTQQLALVQGDRGQIQQAIMNVFSNAVEAMPPGGGRITLRSSIQVLSSETVAGFLYNDQLEPGPYVQFELTDTGIGMDPETLTQIFDPFFTTKRHGRGLGLSATLGIVRAHDGGLHVHSEQGRGTQLTIVLPLQPQESELSSASTARPGQTGSDESPASETTVAQ